jgi:methyl-accepting chemotaxis protein
MTVKVRLLGIIGSFVTLVALLMSVFFVQAYNRGRALRQAVEINSLTNSIAEAEKEIANERSQTAISLTGSPSLGRDSIDIKRLRANTDAALASATRQLSRLYPNTSSWAGAETISSFQTSQDTLSDLRMRADAALAGRPDPAIEAIWYAGADQLALTALSAARIVSNQVTGDAPSAVFVGFEVKNAIWKLLYVIGRQRSYLSMMIKRSQPLTFGELSSGLLLNGQGQGAAAELDDGRAYLGPKYQGALTATGTLLNEFSVTSGIVYRDGANGGLYTLSDSAWQAKAATVMAQLSKLRETTFDEINDLILEREAEINENMFVLSMLAGAVVLLMGGGGLFFVHRIIRRVTTAAVALGKLTSGDSDVVIPLHGGDDEIGTMMGAVGAFQRSLRHSRALEDSAVQLRATADSERRALLQNVASEFELTIGRIVDLLETSAEQQQRVATEMVSIAGEAANKSDVTANSTHKTAAEVALITSSAEGLERSIEQIGTRVDGAATFAKEAVEEANQTNGLVSELGAAANKITGVIGMIASIADSTNLLALNAAIEAARAGEAGRGFGVVAAEVKSLASATARATVQVQEQVKQIQTSAREAIGAIELISTRIRDFSGDALAVSHTVGEHGGSARIILQSVQNAVSGLNEISSAVTDVAQAVSRTGSKSNLVLISAKDLLVRSGELKIEVARFVTKLRAA